MKEVEELHAKLEAWQKCADMLYAYALTCEITMKCHKQYLDEVFEEYKRLKDETQSNE